MWMWESFSMAFWFHAITKQCRTIRWKFKWHALRIRSIRARNCRASIEYLWTRSMWPRRKCPSCTSLGFAQRTLSIILWGTPIRVWPEDSFGINCVRFGVFQLTRAPPPSLVNCGTAHISLHAFPVRTMPEWARANVFQFCVLFPFARSFVNHYRLANTYFAIVNMDISPLSLHSIARPQTGVCTKRWIGMRANSRIISIK